MKLDGFYPAPVRTNRKVELDNGDRLINSFPCGLVLPQSAQASSFRAFERCAMRSLEGNDILRYVPREAVGPCGI